MRRTTEPPQSKDWFRIENAVVDEANSTPDKAVIYIYDEIGYGWFGGTPADEFVQQLSNIKAPKIDLHLNSPGGDVFDGVAIYNALKSHPAEVTVFVDALAASAASFIAQAGDKIVMRTGAMMMIHDGSGLAYGPAAEMRSLADLLDKVSNNVASIYAARTGQSTEFWRNLMIEEVWYNPQEAVDAGLADSVDGVAKPEDLAALQNKWDLSIFNYAGRNAAPNPFAVRQRIANQLKEALVGKPTNSGGTPEQPSGEPESTPKTTDPGNPDENENARTTGEPAADPAHGQGGNGEPGSATPTPNQPPETTTAPDNSAQFFTFDFGEGPVRMTQAQANQKLKELNDFRSQSITAGKKAFVKSLHDAKKITGPQVEAMEKFALSLSDDQYDAWKATWDGASGVPMLQTVVDNTHGGQETQQNNRVADQIETCKAVIKSFKSTNMSDEQIKETPSYKTLMSLDPTFKL